MDEELLEEIIGKAEPFLGRLLNSSTQTGATSLRSLLSAYGEYQDGDLAAAERELVGALGAIGGRALASYAIGPVAGALGLGVGAAATPETSPVGGAAFGSVAFAITAIAISTFGAQVGETVAETATGRLQKRFADGETLFLGDVLEVFEFAANELGLSIKEALNQGADYGTCFYKGTNIAMASGDAKKIESIEVGDLVKTYNAEGQVTSGRVVQLFSRSVHHLLDFHSTLVTPSHAVFCADGPLAGRFVTLLDILRTDGAVVRENGTKFRAATGYELGSLGDRFVAVTKSGSRSDIQKIRFGTRVITEDGLDISVKDVVEAIGGELTEDGLVSTGSLPDRPLLWNLSEEVPRSEDYVLDRSNLSLSEIYAQNEWDEMSPLLPSPETVSQEAKQLVFSHLNLKSGTPNGSL